MDDMPKDMLDISGTISSMVGVIRILKVAIDKYGIDKVVEDIEEASDFKRGPMPKLKDYRALLGAIRFFEVVLDGREKDEKDAKEA